MEPDKKVEISASTNYRFAHAKRIMDLPSFSHFKQEFQVHPSNSVKLR